MARQRGEFEQGAKEKQDKEIAVFLHTCGFIHRRTRRKMPAVLFFLRSRSTLLLKEKAPNSRHIHLIVFFCFNKSVIMDCILFIN